MVSSAVPRATMARVLLLRPPPLPSAALCECSDAKSSNLRPHSRQANASSAVVTARTICAALAVSEDSRFVIILGVATGLVGFRSGRMSSMEDTIFREEEEEEEERSAAEISAGLLSAPSVFFFFPFIGPFRFLQNRMPFFFFLLDFFLDFFFDLVRTTSPVSDVCFSVSSVASALDSLSFVLLSVSPPCATAASGAIGGSSGTPSALSAFSVLADLSELSLLLLPLLALTRRFLVALALA